MESGPQGVHSLMSGGAGGSSGDLASLDMIKVRGTSVEVPPEACSPNHGRGKRGQHLTLKPENHTRA